MCRPTVEGEVSKEGRNKVKEHAEANTKVCNVLHSPFRRSGRHRDPFSESHVDVLGNNSYI